jgi:hypothetical protein
MNIHYDYDYYCDEFIRTKSTSREEHIADVIDWLFREVKAYESNAYSICGTDEAQLREVAINRLAGIH